MSSNRCQNCHAIEKYIELDVLRGDEDVGANARGKAVVTHATLM